jgi:DNA-binding IclR family transcriptional regulator
MARDGGPVVGAAVTAFEVVEAVRTLEEPGVSDVARHLDRSKSGVHKHLTTLQDLGILARTGDTYHVGLGAWAMGTDVPGRFPMQTGAETVDSLAASIDHSVTLSFLEGGAAYYTYRNTSDAVAERIGDVGDRVPLHATAAGKAVLAYLDPESREAALGDPPYEALTNRTVTDPERLHGELERVPEKRTASEHGERADDVASVAAPITDARDGPVGAIAVVGLVEELDDDALEGTLLSLVVNASRSVENALLPTEAEP